VATSGFAKWPHVASTAPRAHFALTPMQRTPTERRFSTADLTTQGAQKCPPPEQG
jgi:hypothetical protein